MKITSIKALVCAPPMFTHMPVDFPKWNYVFVKVETDEGLVGWGDATCGPNAVIAMVEEFGDLLIGEDPFPIEQHWLKLHHHYFARGGPIQNSAIAGIEMALYDIKGKALGVPVYELIGGKLRDRIWVYGRWDGKDPEGAVELAQSQVEMGFTALKGDPFWHAGQFVTWEVEKLALDILKAVREALGFEIELLVECHGRLAPSDAIRIGGKMEEYRPFCMEEPVPPENMDAMQRVAEAINIPIATGERLYHPARFAELCQRQIVSMIQPDLIQCGGIGQLKRIAAIAEVHHVGVQPHAIHGPMETLAALHVDATLPNFKIHESTVGQFDWLQDAVIGDLPELSEGYLPVPTGPGLGCEINEEFVKAHPPVSYGGYRVLPGHMPSKQFSRVASP